MSINAAARRCGADFTESAAHSMLIVQGLPMALFQAVKAGHTDAAAAIAGLLHSVAKLTPSSGPLAEALHDLPSQLAPMFVKLPVKQQKPARQQQKHAAASEGTQAAASAPFTRLPAATQVRLLLPYDVQPKQARGHVSFSQDAHMQQVACHAPDGCSAAQKAHRHLGKPLTA